jgi:hypothetical protein
MPSYHFIRYDGYCGCCTFNYKTIVIHAPNEDALRKGILTNPEIRKLFLNVYEFDECDNGLCEYKHDSKIEDDEYNKDTNDPKVLSTELLFNPTVCNITEEEYNLLLDKYYKTHDILDDIKNCSDSDHKFDYLGDNAEAAYKKCLDSVEDHHPMPDGCKFDPTQVDDVDDGYDCSCKAMIKVFHGRKIYKELDCTEYGRVEFTVV